ncbi:MAG: PEP-CTERM sorting domain-containing protein [Phycisphaerales bacterium]|nr:PEP-CTERM sorting domain-containing protein [Phycisphaerales bacterium]
MSRTTAQIAALAALVAAAGAAQAQVTFDVITDGSITDVSANGKWVAGFLNSGGVYRWSQATGVEILANDSSYNGLAGISADGSRVTASIYDGNGTAGPGVWTEGSGWTYLGAIAGGGVAGEDGSSYGISDDGTTVTGLAWLANYRARAFSWTSGTGMVDLGSSFSDRSSRGSAINGDGSVVGGFDEAEFGNRRPAVWVNGVLTVLEPDGVGEITSVNADGTVVGGSAGNDIGAAVWSFDGLAWNRTDVGLLPGTDPFQHDAQILGITPDGSMAVGFNASGFGPFADYNGTIWTPSDGLMNVETWLTDHGVDFGGMDIRALTGISDDGKVLYGYGYLGGFAPQGFRIVIPAPSSFALLGLGGLVISRRRR